MAVFSREKIRYDQKSLIGLFPMPTRLSQSPSPSSRLPSRRGHLRVVVAGLVAGFLSPVAPEVGAQEAELPLALTSDHFQALQENSPFLRSLDLSDSILLTGIAEIEGAPVATLFNRETRESYVVSEILNSQGWKMVGIDGSEDLEKVAARIATGAGAVITVRFDEGQLKPGEGKPAAAAVPTTPRGPDSRPLPTDEERRKFGEWVKKRMANFSEVQKRKVGEIMQEKMKANPSMTDRQKGEVFVKILDYVETNH